MRFSSVWDFHLYEIFICMKFSSVWNFHLYEIFICMRFLSVWNFHLYKIFICIEFSSVWNFLLYNFCVWFSRIIFAYDFCVWFLRMIFAYDFCVWFLRMIFAYEFCVYILRISFHLWVFIRHFCEVCERSIRAKYVNEARKALFWWNDHHTSIFLLCETCLYHYITSSYVFFKLHVFVISTSLSSFFIKMRIFSKRTIFW
jgi:nitrate reductase NapE component